MNKISKLFLGVAALGVAACSSDEPAVNGPGEVPATGDVAYLNVRITSADGAASKAAGDINTGTTEDDYIYGDEGEEVIKNAHFFFYDNNGNFVTKSDSWVKKQDGTDENVEIIGDNTVILTGLTGKNYPTWVVTILNIPENFTPGNTLAEMQQKVIDSYKNDAGNFIMTTSSYFGDDNKDAVNNDWKYFATRLNSNNFYQETPDKVDFKPEDRVEIYVERLAVRVQVDVKGIANKSLKLEDGRVLYELPVTVAGETNPDLGGSGAGTAATKVYVELVGWDLNATAKRTNLFKNLEGWNDETVIGAGGTWDIPAMGATPSWNHPDYHRSYWGKAFTYGKAEAALAAELNVSNKTYTDLKQKVGTDIFNGTRVYCHENTNEVANITTDGNILNNRATSVLLAARACDEKGEYLQIVSYLGINFLRPNFITKVFELTAPTQYYTRKELKDVNGDLVKDAEGNQLYTYTGIQPDDAEVVDDTDNGTGAVKVALKEGVVAYTLSEPTEVTVTYETAEGTVTQTIKKYTATVATSAANILLATATNGASNKAVAYTDGAMYYPIALEHLNNPDEGTTGIIEGQYGVVRNHIYNLRIKRIKTLGNGVFKPETVGDDKAEILDPKDPKNPTYYVESFINVLSWKIVSQEEEI